MNENRPAKWLAAAATIVAALALQTTIFSRLPLPGHPPNLPLVVVVAVALAGGAGAGIWMGFFMGLAADLISNHPLGLLALVFMLVGAAVGQIESERERSVVASIVVVAVMAVCSFALYLVVLALLPGQQVDWRDQLSGLPAEVLYDVMLTPFVVPVVAAASSRLRVMRRSGTF